LKKYIVYDFEIFQGNMAGYVYLIKMFVSNDQDIYKFGRTKRKFMERFIEYPREAKPKIELVLWHENIQTFETEVLREFRSVFQERKDLGYEYFQGDVETMKQLIVCHYIPTIVNSSITDMLTTLYEQQQTTNAKVQVMQDMIDMFNYDVIRDDIITYLNTSSLVSSQLQNLGERVLNMIDNKIKELTSGYETKVKRQTYQIQEVQKEMADIKDNFQEEIIEIKENIQENIAELESLLTTLERYAKVANHESTKQHTQKESYIDTEKITLTHENILDECVRFTQYHQPDKNKIIETIQLMLASKKYIMCKTMLTKKLQLQQLDKDFKLLAYPESLTQEELQQMLFEA
jgi:hypothetical protein